VDVAGDRAAQVEEPVARLLKAEGYSLQGNARPCARCSGV
jgi:hypothetical protein